jgi:hypothetical protein
MKKFVFLLLFSISLLYSRDLIEDETKNSYDPIFAGTLLAFFPNNIPPGKVLLEPYLFIGKADGTYDANWKAHNQKNFQLQTLWLIETGITPWLDISLSNDQTYTAGDGRKSFLYGDTRLALGFQISTNKRNSWVPDFRVVALENFPSGKYQHLNPKKYMGDVSGSGAYETWIIAIARKIIYFTPRNPITANLNLEVNFPTSVHVKGYNVYGGDPQTDGSVIPGKQFVGNLGLEYSLTLNWILGLDVHYIHQNKCHSSHMLLRAPSSEQFSLAPCIEYNPTVNFGLEIGAWFTFAGRNSSSFNNGVLTLYWLF